MAPQPKTEVCDYWENEPYCPDQPNCAKKHGEAAERFVCKYFRVGKCIFRDQCKLAHPSPVPLDGTVFMDGLLVDRVLDINLRSCEPVPDLDGSRPSLEIRDLSSFGWTAGKTNEIVVPGLPLKLTPPSWPRVIAPDCNRYRESARDYVPDAAYPHMLEPLIRSVQMLLPQSTAIADARIITQHVNLRRLLRLAIGLEVRNFRINVEVQGRTILLDRWDEPRSPTAPVVGRNAQFRDASTGSNGYHEQRQVVEWTLGKTKALVQFPVDAFQCKDDGHTHLHQTQEHSMRSITDPIPGLEMPDVGSLAVSGASDPSLKVIRNGTHVSTPCLVQTSAVDVRNDNLMYLLPDLWLTGVRRVYLGMYRKGPGIATNRDPLTGKVEARAYFDAENVSLKNYSADVEEWIDAKSGLKNFELMLEVILEKVLMGKENTGKKSFALVYDETKPKVLGIHERVDGKAMVEERLAAMIW